MNKPKHEGSGLTLLEAIETLCTIADWEVDSRIMLAETGEVPIGERRAIERLNLEDEDEAVEVIRSIFNLILKYVRGVYREREPTHNTEVIEGIKTIMVLVGEAAKKLDKYTTLFHWVHTRKVTDLNEYRKLQDFYQNRIAHQVDTKMLSRWILGLANQPRVEQLPSLKGRINQQSEHVFVDLDIVRKDSEYELFYVRKEDGTRFFSPQLIRNITLVCDFGDTLNRGSTELQTEPFLDVRAWQDRRMRGSALSIRDYINPILSRFYRETNHYKNRDLVRCLQHAVMALMLSCNPENDLKADLSRKSCFDYFADFLFFLRAALCTRDYQKMIAYPPNRQNKMAYAQLDLAHAMCNGLFLLLQGEQHLLNPIQDLIDLANQNVSPEHIQQKEASHEIWNGLACDYNAMSKLMRNHNNGPLVKILQSLQVGDYQFFDPLWQHNMPCQLYSFFVKDQRMTNIRIPCPVHQEFVHKTQINEEFKAFLRSLQDSPAHHRHLIINFQDRTSWREHARCVALEEMQNIKDFSEHISVVTLTKDSDFYLQNEPYASENHAAVFIENFLDQLNDENCGYYFPQWIKEKMSASFFQGITDAVHRIFFSEKNVLTREQRRDFIEITYLFIELKLLEIVKPETFTLMCKDSVDVSSCANALLYVFMKIANQEEITDKDRQQLNMILYAPALLVRERVLIQDRFNRMINTLRLIEGVQHEYGAANFALVVHEAFGRFFDTQILNAFTTPSKLD